MALQFSHLYNGAARWAGDTTTDGISRAKESVEFANRELSYGLDLPPMRPWWRKREDSFTAEASKQSYNLPTAQGTFESLHRVWYVINGVRHKIEIVDDDIWQEEVNESSTAGTGTPSICNLHRSSGTTELRFDPIPSSSFVSQIDSNTIRLDGFIEETLVSTSGDTVEPLMPDSRRPGIIWKAVEMLAARQGDNNLLLWAAATGSRYYKMILADDTYRTGDKQRVIRPTEPVGEFGGFSSRRRLDDYGFRG